MTHCYEVFDKPFFETSATGMFLELGNFICHKPGGERICMILTMNISCFFERQVNLARHIIVVRCLDRCVYVAQGTWLIHILSKCTIHIVTRRSFAQECHGCQCHCVDTYPDCGLHDRCEKWRMVDRNIFPYTPFLLRFVPLCWIGATNHPKTAGLSH